MPSDVGKAAWWFVAPALILIFVFFFLPVLASLVLSVTDFDIYAIANPSTTRFVGLANYSKLLRTPEFWQALRNTFYFALVGGPLTIAVALGAALLLNARLVRFKSLFRTIYFTPFVTTLVAVAIVWRYLYHTRYGLLNYMLSHFGIAPIDWLGDPKWAMPAIILLAVWKQFGYNMLIFIAGLQAIPQDLYEVSSMDGASKWRQFIRITLPLMKPAILVALLFRTLDSFRIFDNIYILTLGANGTGSVSILGYDNLFNALNLGIGSTISILIFICVAIIAFLFIKGFGTAAPGTDIGKR